MLHGSDLLEQRLLREHIDRLLAEGERNRLSRGARPARPRTPARATAALARVGDRLIALGRRLQALEGRAHSRT